MVRGAPEVLMMLNILPADPLPPANEVVAESAVFKNCHEVTRSDQPGGHRVGVSLSQDRRIRQAVEPAIGRSWHRYRSQA